MLSYCLAIESVEFLYKLYYSMYNMLAVQLAFDFHHNCYLQLFLIHAYRPLDDIAYQMHTLNQNTR